MTQNSPGRSVYARAYTSTSASKSSGRIGRISVRLGEGGGGRAPGLRRRTFARCQYPFGRNHARCSPRENPAIRSVTMSIGFSRSRERSSRSAGTLVAAGAETHTPKRRIPPRAPDHRRSPAPPRGAARSIARGRRRRPALGVHGTDASRAPRTPSRDCLGASRRVARGAPDPRAPGAGSQSSSIRRPGPWWGKPYETFTRDGTGAGTVRKSPGKPRPPYRAYPPVPHRRPQEPKSVLRPRER